ncbi:MAG: FimB/Mfa2 family fimbrial subunit [Tannerellaceae bacterium]|nr:FimB/Mfa2 family fimbrial subunit [Tannerellaceae bacterium]
MIRRTTIGFLVSVLFFLSGCIREDLSDCLPDFPFRLAFIYYGDGTTDIFPSKAASVQMYVFDTDGTYVDRYLYSGDPEAFQGIIPDLEPGTYDLVCWANVTSLSEIIGGDDLLADHYLYSQSYLSGDPILDFDSLYYGRRQIVVPAHQEGKDTVFFSSAHIRMEVYLEGLSSTEVTLRAVGDAQGWLVVRHVYVGYDFMKQVTGEIADMYPVLTPTTQENIRMSRFDLFRFPNDNRILIDVYNGEGHFVYSLDVSDFLAQHHIQVDGVNELTIPIYIRFTGLGNVQVSVDPWDSEIVEPIV